jgi:hypothetical protein
MLNKYIENLKTYSGKSLPFRVFVKIGMDPPTSYIVLFMIPEHLTSHLVTLLFHNKIRIACV